MLALNGAREIIAAKVQLLVMAAGAFDGTIVDPRVRADVVSMRKLLADWPSAIVAVGIEAANAVPYPDQSIESETATVQNHPAVAAYRVYREKQPPENSGVPAPAVLAALYAANSNAEYLKLSRPGRIDVADDGRTVFKESSNGTHRHLVIDAAEKQRITEAFVGMFAARPGTGGRGGTRN
jgi:hypothetical protein